MVAALAKGCLPHAYFACYRDLIAAKGLCTLEVISMKLRILVPALLSVVAMASCESSESDVTSSVGMELHSTVSSSWHVAIETMDMLTSCGSQTNIPVGSATDCTGAIAAAQDLWNSAIMSCIAPDCAWLNMGTPVCWADPYTTWSGSSRTRFQVTLPYECTLCSNPQTDTFAAGHTRFFPPDFPASLQGPSAQLNDSRNDMPYKHTFTWRDRETCELLNGVLSVNVRANSSPMAHNDTISVFHNTAYLFHQSIWNGVVGAPKTITWPLSAAALANAAADRRLSFYVQDDTAVVSATLQLNWCCSSGVIEEAVSMVEAETRHY